MPSPPLPLSQIMIQHPEVSNFGDLLAVIRHRAEHDGRFFLEMDLKPEYPDTPRNWEMLIEEAFSYGER